MKTFSLKKHEKQAHIFKALGHPIRLWIVKQLSDTCEHCVCEFVEANEVDFSTISQHLRILKNCGIITSNKKGKEVYYQLNCKCVKTFIDCIDKKLIK